MSFIIQVVLGALVLALSIAWVISDDGYEPKIVLITAIATLLGFMVNIKNKLWTTEASESSENSNQQNADNAIALAKMIRKYDYHLYKAKTTYVPLFILVMMFFASQYLLSFNEKVISSYDSLMRGEKISEEQISLFFKKIKNRNQLIVEQNQIFMISIVGFFVLLYFFIRPLILDAICRSLYRKTKYLSERSDFKDVSEEVNNILKAYKFLNRETIDIVIKNFTKITKECYMHNLIQ